MDKLEEAGQSFSAQALRIARREIWAVTLVGLAALYLVEHRGLERGLLSAAALLGFWVARGCSAAAARLNPGAHGNAVRLIMFFIPALYLAGVISRWPIDTLDWSIFFTAPVALVAAAAILFGLVLGFLRHCFRGEWRLSAGSLFALAFSVTLLYGAFVSAAGFLLVS